MEAEDLSDETTEAEAFRAAGGSPEVAESVLKLRHKPTLKPV